MMASIRGKNTKPEIIVRRFLHRLGFRFQLHRRDLPGRPDIVLPKYRTVVGIGSGTGEISGNWRGWAGV